MIQELCPCIHILSTCAISTPWNRGSKYCPSDYQWRVGRFSSQWWSLCATQQEFGTFQSKGRFAEPEVTYAFQIFAWNHLRDPKYGIVIQFAVRNRMYVMMWANSSIWWCISMFLLQIPACNLRHAFMDRWLLVSGRWQIYNASNSESLSMLLSCWLMRSITPLSGFHITAVPLTSSTTGGNPPHCRCCKNWGVFVENLMEIFLFKSVLLTVSLFCSTAFECHFLSHLCSHSSLWLCKVKYPWMDIICYFGMHPYFLEKHSKSSCSTLTILVRACYRC